MTPEENRIVGNFGEYVLAYYLSKNKINVMRVDTVFFDLVVKDPTGEIFDKNQIIGISIKLRDRTGTTPSCTIPHKDYEKIDEYGEKWNIKPYICHMIIFQKEDKKILQSFIFSNKEAKKYFAKGKRDFAISFSMLRKDIGIKFTKNKNYFEWIL